jgi:signal transduction histidine kinase
MPSRHGSASIRTQTGATLPYGPGMEAHALRDVAAAAVLTVGGLVEGAFGLTGDRAPWYVLVTVPLVTAAPALRRRPGLAVPGMLAGFLAQGSAGSELPGGFAEPIALLLVVYAMGAHLEPRRGVPVVAAIAGVMAVVVTLQGQVHPANFVFLATIIAAAWAAGFARRTATEHAALRAEQRATQDRTRIARELHDVVSHNVSAMVVQAATERRSRPDSDPAAAILEEIEGNGRATLTELRRLLGVLRLDDTAPVEPQPRLRDLPGLVAGAQRAGQEVSLEVEGSPRALGDGVELAVFRVVQEGLTNAHKHAPGNPTHVHLSWQDEFLDVVVRNACRASPPEHAVPGSGFGIASMRERIEAYDGTLEAGRRGSEFLVRAHLPIGSTR